MANRLIHLAFAADGGRGAQGEHTERRQEITDAVEDKLQMQMYRD